MTIDVLWAESDGPVTPRDICPMKTIILQVCRKHGISYLEMMSRRRQRVLSRPRQEAYYRCYTETQSSFPEISRAFANRDPTTIIHGVKAHKKRMKENENVET